MGDLMLRLNDEKVNFNIFEGMKNQKEMPQCFKVDAIENPVEIVKPNEDVKESPKKEAPKLSPPKLKALPPNWKYVFLGDGCKQPVIISSLLTPLEEEEFLKDLKK
ncbi:hypothetical protein A2U01_0057787, partial [Trifolium medium]|nr:hypothetical protein [Trifolium medium]